MAHKDVVVITGIGGMGTACARRIGAGHQVVIADFAADTLEREASALAADGFDVVAHALDVASPESVHALAERVAELGRVRTLVHTAGISPTMATSRRILEVDLVGTDHVIDAFLPLAADGTVAVCIASMGGYMAGLSAEQERALATVPTDRLLEAVAIDVDEISPAVAYCIAKRVNMLRVERAAPAWGARGARIVTVSPGIISTSMGRQERDEQPMMEQQLAISPIPRVGTAEDIAAAVEWLASPAASFVTGCDLRVDGGVTAAIQGFIAS